MPTHKSEDYKLSAVEYYLTEDKTQEEVCKIFKCSARSLLRWVDKYNQNGEIKRHNRKPVAYKVHKDQVKFILDEIKKNKTITMQDLLEKLKEKYPTLSLSRFHLNRIVNDNNITLKITRLRHDPNKRFGKDIDINKKIKETDKYYKEIEKREYPEIKNIQKIYPVLVNIYENIKYTFENSQSRLQRVKTEFETTVGNMIQNVVDIGNNLVNHLKLKMKVPKWDKRKKLVNGYEKINKYLKNKKIKPYLDKIKEDPENVAKIQNIKKLPQKAKTGPKKK